MSGLVDLDSAMRMGRGGCGHRFSTLDSYGLATVYVVLFLKGVRAQAGRGTDRVSFEPCIPSVGSTNRPQDFVMVFECIDQVLIRRRTRWGTAHGFLTMLI